MASSDEGPAATAAIRAIVIDCLDLDRSAAFWGALLDLEVDSRMGDYLFFENVFPGCRLTLQQVESVTADKSPIHLDLHPTEFGPFVARVLNLGGTIIEHVEEDAYALVVMGDPDGNEFCVNQRLSPALDNTAQS